MSHRSKVLDISFFNHQRYSDKAIYILLKRTFYFFSMTAQFIVTLSTPNPRISAKRE